MASKSRTPRHRGSDTFKKRVVAEANRLGVIVAEIAHRYDLDARPISNWKTKSGSGGMLVLVEATPDDDNVSMLAYRSPSCIEIALPCATRVRCHADANMELMADIIGIDRAARPASDIYIANLVNIRITNLVRSRIANLVGIRIASLVGIRIANLVWSRIANLVGSHLNR